MPTKTTSSYVARVLSTTQQNSTGAPVTTEANQRLKLTRTRTGVELVGWQDKIRSKEVNATTPLDASEFSVQAYSPARFRATSNGIVKLVYGTGIEDSNWRNPGTTTTEDNKLKALTSAAEAQALGKALSKIQAVMNPFGASVMLGELRETISFLRNPLNQSRKLAKALSDSLLTKKYLHGDAISRKNLKALKEYANSLLEARFGVQPIIADSIAILEAASTIANRNNTLSFRCYGSGESSTTTSSSINVFSSSIKCVQEVTTTLKSEVVIRFGIKESIDGNGSTYDAVSANLRDIANVPGVLYELTALSWLVDYFVNVSDIIRAVTTSTKSVIWQSKSVITTKTVRVTSHSFSATNGFTLENSSNQVTTVSLRSVKRTTSALTIPSVQFSLPGGKQIENTAALLLQKLI